MQPNAPTLSNQRIEVLDALRGIAVLGILLMNIPYFALPAPTQFWDLVVLNEIGTINETVWMVVTGIFNGTMRALFCTMFGAGIILFTERQEKKTSTVLSADFYHRRHLWLIVFGLFHCYILLWPGDYLFMYGCCGLLLYTFRRLSAKQLLLAASICALFMITRENVDLYRSKKVINEGEQIAMIDTSITKLLPIQKEKLSAMQSLKAKSSIESRKKEVTSSLKKIGGSYRDLYKYSSEFGFQIMTSMLFNKIWDLLSFMFFGMAFFKSGFLMGKLSPKPYWILFFIGMGIGLMFSFIEIERMLHYAFNKYDVTKVTAFNFAEVSRILRSLGILAFIILLFKSGYCKLFFKSMTAVGRMAFTNYVTQSILMGLFFYGIGFGMFGKLQRFEIYYVVGVTWVIQILWSCLWLRYFEYGPFEWLWRQLTYWKRLPLKN